MAETVTYLHLPAGSTPPEMGDRRPYKALVVIEQAVANDWQNQISGWLVETGCLCMMAWGRNCSSWDDSVDWANLARFDFDVPDDALVMTSWHENEPLEETMWFAASLAFGPGGALDRTIIIDISAVERAAELLCMFDRAHAEGA